jgi:hypothetical protein
VISPPELRQAFRSIAEEMIDIASRGA